MIKAECIPNATSRPTPSSTLPHDLMVDRFAQKSLQVIEFCLQQFFVPGFDIAIDQLGGGEEFHLETPFTGLPAKGNGQMGLAAISAFAVMLIVIVVLILLPYEIPMPYSVLIVLAVGVITFLAVLYFHPTRLYRRLAWACIAILAFAAAVPALKATGVFGENWVLWKSIRWASGEFLGSAHSARLL